jgi:6-pyruvoyltetrahydropterin/6-carboxytetrahydropterin synthase
MFEIRVKTHFSAAHRLDGYPGDCARVHGHNWIVEAFVQTELLDDTGIGIDFRHVKKSLETVNARLDHRMLNEVPPFDRHNPTSENIAKYIFDELGAELASIPDHAGRVSKVTVSETPGAGASYFE